MQQVYPNDGLDVWLTLMTSANTIWGLFANNATIDRTILPAGLTPAAWAGYASVTIAGGSWTISVTGNLGFAIAAPISFLNGTGAPATAYGYYVMDVTNTILLAVGKFDAFPITIAAGDSYVLIPSIGDLSRATVSP